MAKQPWIFCVLMTVVPLAACAPTAATNCPATQPADRSACPVIGQVCQYQVYVQALGRTCPLESDCVMGNEWAHRDLVCTSAD